MASVDTRHSTIAIGTEQVELARSVRRFLDEQGGSSIVRHAIDSGERDARALRAAMHELGWLTLAVPERFGGQGFGVSEAVLIAEELGRAVATGPTVASMVAGVVLRSALTVESNAQGADLLARITSGEVTAVVSGVSRAGSVGPDGEIRLASSSSIEANATEADLVIVPLRVPTDGDEHEAERDLLWLVPAEGIVIEPLEPLDLTRSIARVSIDERILAADDPTLVACDHGIVDAIEGTFVAAECAGLAAWCVDTAADYAAHRQQFGRPIGQFQAVKHRCADMLVATEAIRGLVWDAAAAGDAALTALENADDETARSACRQWELAASGALAYALDATVKVAEDCIQVLGGIGFTWEHDAHLYLRRAVANRQRLGGSARWRAATADLALASVRRRLRVDLPDEAENLRAEIRAQAEALVDLDESARRTRLVEIGWLVPHWPKPWGIDAGPVTQLLIDEELRRVKVRRPHLQVGAWAAPTIAAHGTTAQQERWVRPTLEGTTSWCQLFSEPEAGSDLAGLRTRAVRVAGGWSVTGQKVWTTVAREAEWGICLVRTDPSAPKHAGITYLIVDMNAPGIEIRPLREMTGLEMFNEVFFEDVFVPDDCVIGDVNGGWALARTTLGNERVAMGAGSSFGGGIENLLRLFSDRPREDATAPAPTAASELREITGEYRRLSPEVRSVGRDRLGGLLAEAHAVATLGARATLRSLDGARPGPESSVRKLLGVEHDQRVQEFGLELLGPAGAAVDGDAATWTFGFLANRCLTIAGGTSEIQRNVIGERLLGLPRDPEPQ